MKAARCGCDRLSTCSRGKDEGEGFKQIRPHSTFTIPLSLPKGEATRYTRSHTKLSWQT